MKRSAVLLWTCLVLSVVTTSAYCAEGFYAGGNLGLAVVRDFETIDFMFNSEMTLDFESRGGLAYGIAAGYDFGNSFRVEGEIAYQKNDLDRIIATEGTRSADITDMLNFEGETSTLAILGNGYYLFPTAGAFSPFVSAGLGFAKVNASMSIDYEGEEADADEDDTVFAYQIGAGIECAVYGKIFIGAKYRYFATSDPELDGVETEYSSHNLYLGLRVPFNF